MGGGKTVTYKGHTVIHDDPETKRWFYQLLASGMAMAGDDGNAFTRNLKPELFVKFLRATSFSPGSKECAKIGPVLLFGLAIKLVLVHCTHATVLAGVVTRWHAVISDILSCS